MEKQEDINPEKIIQLNSEEIISESVVILILYL